MKYHIDFSLRFKSRVRLSSRFCFNRTKDIIRVGSKKIQKSELKKFALQFSFAISSSCRSRLQGVINHAAQCRVKITTLCRKVILDYL